MTIPPQRQSQRTRQAVRGQPTSHVPVPVYHLQAPAQHGQPTSHVPAPVYHLRALAQHVQPQAHVATLSTSFLGSLMHNTMHLAANLASHSPSVAASAMDTSDEPTSTSASSQLQQPSAITLHPQLLHFSLLNPARGMAMAMASSLQPAAVLRNPHPSRHCRRSA